MFLNLKSGTALFNIITTSKSTRLAGSLDLIMCTNASLLRYLIKYLLTVTIWLRIYQGKQFKIACIVIILCVTPTSKST